MAEEKKVVDAPVEEAKEEELTFRKPTDRDYEVLRYMIVTVPSQGQEGEHRDNAYQEIVSSSRISSAL